MIRILHLPRNPASVAWIISRAQRKLGYKSDVMVLENKKLNIGYDYNFHLENYPKVLKYLVGGVKFSSFLCKAIRNYDIFHIHFKSILPFQIDAMLFKKFNKKVFFHFHGCDVRVNCPHPICQKNKWKKIKLMEIAKKVANGIITSSPDILQFIPDAKYIPVPIDLEEWKISKFKKNQEDYTINILHAPSDRFIKGTDIILKSIHELKKDGYNIKFLLVENIPRSEVKKIYLKADIVIDQIILGWYGTFAIECMALEKPVCAYIREDLSKFAKGCPIVNINKENIKEKLITLIENKNLRKKIGKKSRKYVERTHDSVKVSKKIIKFYNLF